MPRGDLFSLAAAVFGWPAGEGYAEPLQNAPDTWLVTFREKHVTPAVLSGVFSSCKSGREWALREAPKLKYQPDFSTKVPGSMAARQEIYRARFESAKQCLSLRGSLPTTLVLSVDWGLETSVFMLFCNTLGGPRAPAIMSLEFRARCVIALDKEKSFAALLGRAAKGWPQVTSLTIHRCPCNLPPPTTLPALTHLSVHFDKVPEKVDSRYSSDYYDTYYYSGYKKKKDDHSDSFWSSVAAYTPRVTSLTLQWAQERPRDISWRDLFPTASQTLTSLSITNEGIDYDLIWALLAGAPKLKHFSGGHLGLYGSGDYYGGTVSTMEWSLETLRARGVSSDDLLRLPKQQEGIRLQVQGTKDISFFANETGLRTEVMERVAHLSFQDATIIIHGHDSLNTAALITTLGQLEQLHTTGRTIVDFVDWQWDAESLRALIASLPDLQHLTISAAVEVAGPLTDELLGVVLQLGSRVRSLSVPSLALQSDQHISAVWPWHSLTVDSLDVSQLALLPCPKGGGHTGRIVKCEDVRLDDTVTKAGVERLTECLAHMRFFLAIASYPRPSKAPRLTISLHAPGDITQQPESLRTQLSVLRAVQLTDKQPHKKVRLQLTGWHMTHDVIDALQGLPAWSGPELDFMACTAWPREATEHTHLAESVPASYTVWRLDMCPCSPVLRGICVAVNERRKRDGLTALECRLPTQEVQLEYVKVTSSPRD